MLLRDHFRSPGNDFHSWDEVHGGWPAEMVRDLKTILPAGFRAAPKVYRGSSFEVNVSAYQLRERAVESQQTPRTIDKIGKFCCTMAACPVRGRNQLEKKVP